MKDIELYQRIMGLCAPWRVTEVRMDVKAQEIEDTEAFRRMGLLFGRGVLSPRQLSAVKQEWLLPSHTEFRARTAWSFYNACTEALKSCPHLVIMEKHILLHSMMAGAGDR